MSIPVTCDHLIHSTPRSLTDDNWAQPLTSPGWYRLARIVNGHLCGRKQPELQPGNWRMSGGNTGLAWCSQASTLYRRGYFVGQLAQQVSTFNNSREIVTGVDNSWGLLTHWAGASVSVNIWSQQSSRDDDSSVLYRWWIITVTTRRVIEEAM